MELFHQCMLIDYMFKVSKKIIVSGAIGNALEMYDYAIWSLFSVYLTKEFLPPQSNLKDMFILFLITYFLRPIGGFFFGLLSDQLGRKKILTISIFIMGLCTTAVGIIPSYQHIGVIAVFLLLFSRLIQVLAVGGEYISSIAFLIESCEKSRKGYFGSWAAFGVNAGVLFASLIGAIILYCMKMGFLPENGWRIAFVVSFITTMMGCWVRNAVPESFEFIIANARKERRTVLDIAKETFRTIKTQFIESLLVFTLVWFGVSATMLIFIYAPIHMVTINNLVDYQSFSINSISLLLVIIMIPIFGMMSDRYGRSKMLFISIIFLLMMIIPYYVYLSTGNFYEILFCHLLIGIPCASIFSITPVFITELFPLSIRCASAGLIYSIAACFGGGITPLLALFLSHSVYGSHSPWIVLLFPGLLSLIVLFCLKFKDDNQVVRLTLASDNT